MTQDNDKDQERDELWESWRAHSQAQTEARKDDSNDFHDEDLASFAGRNFFVVEGYNEQRKRNTTTSPVEQLASVQQQKKARKETFHDGNDAIFLLLVVWLCFFLCLLFSSCWSLKQTKKPAESDSANNKSRSSQCRQCDQPAGLHDSEDNIPTPSSGQTTINEASNEHCVVVPPFPVQERIRARASPERKLNDRNLTNPKKKNIRSGPRCRQCGHEVREGSDYYELHQGRGIPGAQYKQPVNVCRVPVDKREPSFPGPPNQPLPRKSRAKTNLGKCFFM